MGALIAMPYGRETGQCPSPSLRAEHRTPAEFARHISERLELGKVVEERAARICDMAVSSGARIGPDPLLIGAAAVCVASLVVKAEEILERSPTFSTEGILFTDINALLRQRRVRASIERAGFEIEPSARFTDTLRVLHKCSGASPDVAKILASMNKIGKRYHRIVLPEQELTQHLVLHRT